MKRERHTNSRQYSEPSSTSITEFREKILEWFTSNGRDFPWRKNSATHYQLILAEVLLQRTRAEAVKLFWPSFIETYPSWKELSKASEAELQERFKPIGLWKRRAASLYLLAQEMNKRRGRFPKDADEIESLPGIGQYIKNAILLFCHGDPNPLLDSNMARVLERYFEPRLLADIRDDPYLQSLARKIVNCREAILINWAILDLAAQVCQIKKPSCSECCLKASCRYANEGIEINS